jgi:hypothetical protein
MRTTLNLIRYSSWWSYKIPLFIILYFLPTASVDYRIDLGIFNLFVGLFLIVIGASFVSVLNDFTDREADNIAGKKNNFDHLSKVNANLIMVSSTLIVLVAPWIFDISFLANLFYYLAVLSYALYSVKPVRFKNRGFLGVLFDSLGSVVFPAIFFLEVTHQNLWLNVFSDLGLFLFLNWLLFFSIRSILIHQVDDLYNDRKSDVRTWVSILNERQLKWAGWIIFCIEVTSFLLLLWNTRLLFNEYVYIIILTYILFQLLFYQFIGVRFSIFGNNQMNTINWLLDYYNCYFLISLILLLPFTLYYRIIIIGTIILIFPVYFIQQFNCIKATILRLTIYRPTIPTEHIEPKNPNSKGKKRKVQKITK